MDAAAIIGVLIGLVLLWRRWPRPAALAADPPNPWPRVSVIVPARDEALTLPTLLASLTALDYPDFEVLVVDDGSTDGTADVARRHGGPLTRVITGVPRPAGWRGKQWACAQGAQAASGEVLLFTDADTEHAPDSLKRAVATLRARQAGMLSTLPYHAGTAWWERLTGPFHVLMLTVTRPYGEPQARRAYAIGQYLLFARDAYLTLGGHAAVRDELVEDLPLAQAFIAQGGRYVVATDGAPYFRVRMYASLAEFVAGWRRNVRAGLGRSPALAPVEVTLMILALVGGGTAMWPAGIVLAALAIGLTARAQRRLGAFSAWGAVLFPFAVALFSAVTVLAVFDMATRRPQVWKGRAYPAT